MRRVASLFLPHWSTDRLRWNRALTPPEAPTGSPEVPSSVAPGAPVATVARSGGSRLLVALDAQAVSLGLAPGMTVTQARLLVPELALAAADPVGDAAALRGLGEWALRRYAPQIALASQGLWIETQGASHLHGGEAALIGDLLHRLARRGISARAAIADTSGAAFALSAHGAHAAIIVPPHAQLAALAALPPAALRLEPDTLDLLARLGIETIGALAALPRAPLARRLGLQVLRRLDQATGDSIEPLDWLVLPAPLAARIALFEPLTSAPALARLVATLAVQLCGQLEAQ
ncbi:MAG: Y-family DNA polymerase, partial [Polymorphobacter sp.]